MVDELKDLHKKIEKFRQEWMELKGEWRGLSRDRHEGFVKTCDLSTIITALAKKSILEGKTTREIFDWFKATYLKEDYQKICFEAEGQFCQPWYKVVLNQLEKAFEMRRLFWKTIGGQFFVSLVEGTLKYLEYSRLNDIERREVVKKLSELLSLNKDSGFLGNDNADVERVLLKIQLDMAGDLE